MKQLWNKQICISVLY